MLHYSLLNKIMILTERMPEISDSQACRILRKFWNIEADVTILSSERDHNYMVHTNGNPRYLLKISHPGEDRGVGNLQTSTLLHIAKRDPDLPVPRVLPSKDGEYEVFITLSDGQESMVRLFSFLQGEEITLEKMNDEIARNMGNSAARLDIALSDLTHPCGDHDLLWDTRKLPDLAGYLPYINDPEKRKTTEQMLAMLCDEILPQLSKQQQQLIHNDFNLGNLCITANRVTGIMDFGDMLWSYRVIDPANLCAYLAKDHSDPFQLSRISMEEYIKINPLNTDERNLLPYLTIGRAMVTILITNWRASLLPDQVERTLRHEPEAYNMLKRAKPFLKELPNLFWGESNV